MQAISIVLVAVLLFLTDAPRVSSRIPRDGVDPRTQEQEENTKQSGVGTISNINFQEQNEPVQPRTNQEADEHAVENNGAAAPPCNNPFGCKKETQEAEMDPAEYRRLRIEVIKETILQKLRLKSPPQVKLNRLGLPSVLLSNSDALLPNPTDGQDDANSRSANLRVSPTPTNEDSFYGTTKNVFVFPENSSTSQIQCLEHTSACLTFRLPPEATSGTLVAAHLWLHKQSTACGAPTTLVVTELTDDPELGLLRKRVMSLEDEKNELSSEEWLRLRVDNVVKRWFENPHILHALEISCEEGGNQTVAVSQAEPFLEISLNTMPSLRRTRREVASPNTTTLCSLERSYVNFTELGWSDWIIAPQGFFANYCKGTCSIENNQQKLNKKSLPNQLYRELTDGKIVPASTDNSCAPSEMSSISLVYFDNERNILFGSLHNVVVDSCGCA